MTDSNQKPECICGEQYREALRIYTKEAGKKIREQAVRIEELEGKDGKKHFMGATYELQQKNFNHLISQLDGARERIEKLESALAVMRKGLEEIDTAWLDCGCAHTAYSAIEKAKEILK